MQPELLPLPIPPAVAAEVRCLNPGCNRVLTDPKSRARKFGRCCAETFGLTTTTTRLRWAPQTGQGLFEINEGDEMAKTIEIQGVWLVKQHAHLGNGIQVLVQTADGQFHEAITETADDGPISHYVHPAGIETSPVVTFDEPVEAS